MVGSHYGVCMGGIFHVQGNQEEGGRELARCAQYHCFRLYGHDWRTTQTLYTGVLTRIVGPVLVNGV
jgi:hypothetical protein